MTCEHFITILVAICMNTFHHTHTHTIDICHKYLIASLLCSLIFHCSSLIFLCSTTKKRFTNTIQGIRKKSGLCRDVLIDYQLLGFLRKSAGLVILNMQIFFSLLGATIMHLATWILEVPRLITNPWLTLFCHINVWSAHVCWPCGLGNIGRAIYLTTSECNYIYNLGVKVVSRYIDVGLW